MTTPLLTTVTAAPTVESDDSVVAITLSWPVARSVTATSGGRGGIRGGGSHIIEFIGDVDLHFAGHVRGTLAAIAAQSRELTVDVSEVRFIDAAGLGLLAMMHGHVTASGGRMDLIGAAPTLRRALRITQLDELFPGDPTCR
jgi:anti-anti-sigma factor